MSIEKPDRPHIDPDYTQRLRSLPPPVQGPPAITQVTDKDQNEVTLTPSYDILKKDAAALVWVQAMDDLELAKLRIRRMVGYGT